MSLSDLASLGSFVSGVAVLASLVFLYVQLRQLAKQFAQADTNQRTMINESYVSRAGEYLRWQANPESSSLFIRVLQGDQSFTAEELARLGLNFRAAVINTQAVSQHYKVGLIDRESFDSAILSFKHAWLSQPVYRAMWASQAMQTSPSFRKVVEDMLRELPLVMPIDVVANFNADLARVLAAGTPAQ